MLTKLQEEDQGFQLMKVQKSSVKSDLEGDIRMTKKTSKMERIQQETYDKKKKSNKKQKQSESQQQQKPKKKTKKKKLKRKYQADEQSQEDNESSDYKNNKKKAASKKKKQQSSPHSSQQELGQLPQLTYSPKKMSSMKYPQQISPTQKKKLNRNMSKNTDLQHSTNNLARNSSLRMTKIHYDVQKPKANILQQSQQSQIQIRQSKAAAQSKYMIKLQAIHQQELDWYLQQHFTQLPEIQRIIQLIEREQLFRKLIGQLTFCLLIGWEGNICVGMAFAYHDRSKTDLRKFTLVHISSYHNEQLKDFIISTVNYIFKKDPCDQIQFHYKFNQANENELAFSTDFNKWFDKHGNVYQKRIDDNFYERKYVMKRQFNQKCDVMLGGVNKNTFRNLFTVYCGVIMSDSDMIQFKEQLRDVITPENQISYAIMIAQLFRTYLTPDQAEVLKTKVKQFAKLKELLILVVMLQKKKVKMEQIKLSQFKNLIELNMKLMSQGKDLIRYCKDGGMDHNRIYYAELTQNFNLPFNFQTTSLPVEANQSQIRQISYFRLSPLPPHKLHIIKSSLYNSQLHILPTENIKYKLFVINAQQYNQIKQINHLDVFMYVRLFLKNVKSHNVASWKYVWLPQMTDKAAFSIRQFKSFLNKDIYCHDSLNISYKQFLPNAMIIQPEHRDLVITPPFIVGVMSMSLEQITQGSPLYARMINVDALRTLQIQQQ